MANLMIAPQQANADASHAAALKGGASALPADVKVAGRSASQQKAEAKDASEQFAASLKEQTKKSALDSTAEAAKAAQAAQAQLLAQAKPQQAQVANSKVSLKDLGNEAGKDGKGAVSGKTHSMLDQLRSKQDELMGKALKGEDLGKAGEKNANLASAQAGAQGARSLNPLQEALLNSQTQINAKTALNRQSGATAVDAMNLPQALAGASEFDHDFEIDSLDVKSGAGKNTAEALLSSKDGVGEKRTPSSKVSTADFLDLRNLSQKNSPIAMSEKGQSLDLGTALKGKKNAKDEMASLGGKEAFSHNLSHHLEVATNVKTMDAPVTTGSAGKTVLTHESIQQMTSQVNQLAQARQDGEIKIRLRPDHLGELHMSVKAQGNQVAIEIKAHNAESKKIIEESLSSLKDSLASQNLSLARIDVVAAPTQAQSAADQGMQMDMSQFRQNSGQGRDQSFDQGSSRHDQRFEDMSAPVNISSARRGNLSTRGGQGLDLIA